MRVHPVEGGFPQGVYFVQPVLRAFQAMRFEPADKLLAAPRADDQAGWYLQVAGPEMVKN